MSQPPIVPPAGPPDRHRTNFINAYREWNVSDAAVIASSKKIDTLEDPRSRRPLTIWHQLESSASWSSVRVLLPYPTRSTPRARRWPNDETVLAMFSSLSGRNYSHTPETDAATSSTLTLPPQHPDLITSFSPAIRSERTTNDYNYVMTDTSLHMLSTDPFRPFKCPVECCAKTFISRSHLDRHIRCHTREKPYKCIYPSCPKSFGRRDSNSPLFSSSTSSSCRVDMFSHYRRMHGKLKVITSGTNTIVVPANHDDSGLPVTENNNDASTLPFPPTDDVHVSSDAVNHLKTLESKTLLLSNETTMVSILKETFRPTPNYTASNLIGLQSDTSKRR